MISGCCFYPMKLKRKISVIILREIQCLRLWRDAFTGIVLEFAALSGIGYHTLPAAQNLTVCQSGTVAAIFAGTLDLLSKQHNEIPLSI